MNSASKSPLPWPARAVLSVMVVGAAMLGVSIGAKFPTDASDEAASCSAIDPLGELVTGEPGDEHIAGSGERFEIQVDCDLAAVAGSERAAGPDGSPQPSAEVSSTVQFPATQAPQTQPSASPPVTSPTATTAGPVTTAPTPPTPQPPTTPPPTSPPDTAPPTSPETPELELVLKSGESCQFFDAGETKTVIAGDTITDSRGRGYFVRDDCSLLLVLA